MIQSYEGLGREQLIKRLNSLHQKYEEFKSTSQMIQEELETENKDLQKRVNMLQTKNQNYTNKIESLEGKISTERKEKEKLENKIKQLEAEMGPLKGYIVSMEIENDELNRQCRVQQTVVQDLQIRLDTTIEEMAMIQTELEDQKYDSQAQIRRLTEQLSQVSFEKTLRERKPFGGENNVRFNGKEKEKARRAKINIESLLSFGPKRSSESLSKFSSLLMSLRNLQRQIKNVSVDKF